MLSTVIIDDEAPARSNLRNLLKMTNQDISLVGEADGVHTGYDLICKLHPEIVLLDINMNDGTGFDLLSRFSKPFFHPILITAHRRFDFAEQAFKFKRQFPGIDFIVKPIDPDELTASLRSKNFQHFPRELPKGTTGETISRKVANPVRKLILDTQEGSSFLPLSEIIRLESVSGYTFFFTADGSRELVAKNIGAFSRRLPEEIFLQPHQSHIVNLGYVVKFLNKSCKLLLRNGDKVPVARRRREEVLKILKRGSI